MRIIYFFFLATLLAGIPLVMRFGLMGAGYGLLLSGATCMVVLALAVGFHLSHEIAS
jgi:O-antigen/teichoic acid export membrane protein